ncbi:MAG TPA: hypothetical protein VF647_16970 [Longimicrobium sp.]|jgi:hypothetical protein
MFYYNVRWAFKLPDNCSVSIPGGIIAASAVPQHGLIRRRFGKFPHLQHRLFDPQLYLGGLSADRSRKAVVKLSSYGWFSPPDVPSYDSSIHGKQADWTNTFQQQILEAWRGSTRRSPAEIAVAARAAVQLQVDLECDAIILPSPLTNTLTTSYEDELAWLDAGLEACVELRVRSPIYATVAISDVALRGLDPQQNTVLSLISDQVSARGVAGAYIVIEQASEDGYVCGDENTLYSLLQLVDDFTRGARLDTIVNYAGTFGAVAAAAGAKIWSSGYYLGQRKLRLSEFEAEEEDVRLAYPRYYSLALAGDVGLRGSLDALNAGGFERAVFSKTDASQPLHDALSSGAKVDDVATWTYRASNITAAAAHYNDTVAKLGGFLHRLSQPDRVEFVHKWLCRAVELSRELHSNGFRSSHHTELSHQAAWLRAFERWRDGTIGGGSTPNPGA